MLLECAPAAVHVAADVIRPGAYLTDPCGQLI